MNEGTVRLNDAAFWRRLDQLVATARLETDRPKRSTHPRFPAFLYRYDYGYLEGTRSGDGDGIDVWIGSLPNKSVTGIICSVDTEKRDAEVKILLGCTPQEAQDILLTHTTGEQSAIMVERPAETTPEIAAEWD